MTDAQRAAVLKLYGLESLDQATRENWPWWQHWSWSDEATDSPDQRAVFPDPATDDAAALILWRKLARKGRIAWARPDIRGEGWSVSLDYNKAERGFTGPTLGAALLAALENA